MRLIYKENNDYFQRLLEYTAEQVRRSLTIKRLRVQFPTLCRLSVLSSDEM